MDITRMECLGRMSDVVVYNSKIYLSGQVGDGATVTEQTKDALAAVDRLLEKAGSDKSHILSATIWLQDMTDFAEMNAVWDAWVDRTNPPARACGEARLAEEALKVEIIVIAAMRS